MRSSEFLETQFCDQLIEYIANEGDPLIVENMIDPNTPWSVINQMKNGRFEDNGYVSVITEGDRIIGFSGCERSDQVFTNSINIGIRFWIHPDHRARGLIAVIINSQLSLAIEEKKICWLSFNDSRKSLIKYIQQRQHADSDHVRAVSSGFVPLKEPVIVNNVPQWVMYRDCR